MPLPLRCILAVALTAAASCPAAAVVVGHIEGLTPAYGAATDTAAAEKRIGEPVADHEWLETSSSRGLHVRLSDGAQLTIGTDSRLRVDASADDPAHSGDNATTRATISLPIGIVRYVTGGMPNGAVTIETPTATLMLRATNVAVAVNQLGETLLVVDDGEVAVRNKATGNQVVVGTGDILDIKAAVAADRILPAFSRSSDAQRETAAKSDGDSINAKHTGNDQHDTGESSTGSNGVGKQSASNSGGGAGRGSSGSQSGAGAGRDGPPKPGGAGAGRDGPPNPGGAGAGRNGPPNPGGAGAGRDGPPKSGGAGAGRDGPPKSGGAGASK